AVAFRASQRSRRPRRSARPRAVDLRPATGIAFVGAYLEPDVELASSQRPDVIIGYGRHLDTYDALAATAPTILLDVADHRCKHHQRSSRTYCPRSWGYATSSRSLPAHHAPLCLHLAHVGASARHGRWDGSLILPVPTMPTFRGAPSHLERG